MSDHVPSPGRPGREAEVLEALREVSRDNLRLVELPPEEVTRRFVLGGLLREEPSCELVAEVMLDGGPGGIRPRCGAGRSVRG